MLAFFARMGLIFTGGASKRAGAIVEEPPNIDEEHEHAHQDCAGDNQPVGQVGIDQSVEKTREKRRGRRRKAGASFKPGLEKGEGAHRPGKNFDDDGPDDGGDMDIAKNRAAAREHPADEDPRAPEYVKEENQFSQEKIDQDD